MQAEIDDSANGYIKDTANACYWNPGDFQGYFDQSGFYLPKFYCDPFHYNDWSTATTYAYDDYHLLIQQVTAPLDNEVSFQIDYQVVHPIQHVDINGNISEVLFDPLGRVIAVSDYGTEGGQTIGFDSLDKYTVQDNPTVDDIINNPSTYLQNAAAFFYYDLFAWKNNQQPVCTVQLGARQFTYARDEAAAASSNNDIMMTVAYSDGLGRLLQAKEYLDQPDTTVRYWDADAQQVAEKTVDTCWLTNFRRGAIQQQGTCSERV